MPFVCTICNVATKPADCALTCCFKSFGLHAACLNAYWLSEGGDVKCPHCQAEVPGPIHDMVSTALSRAAQPGKTGAAKVKKTIRKAEMPPAAPKKQRPKPVPKSLKPQNTTTKTKAAAPPKKTIKKEVKREGLEGQTFTCPGGKSSHCRPSGCSDPWKGKAGKQQYTRHMENCHDWPKVMTVFVPNSSKLYKKGCKYCAKGFRNNRDMESHLLSDRHKDHSKEQKKKNTTTENTTTTVEVEFGAPKPLSQVLPVAQQEGAAEEAAAPAVEEDFKKVRLKFEGTEYVDFNYYAWHVEEPESEVVRVEEEDWPKRTAEEEAAWCIEKCIELLENAPPEFSGIQLKLRGMGSWISNYRYKPKEHFSFGKDVLPLEVGSIVDIDKFSDALSDLLYNQPGHRFSGMNCADACIILMSETDPEVLPPDWKAKLSQHDIALRKVIVP